MTNIYDAEGELRPLIGFDFETYLINQNLAAPRAVCGSFMAVGGFPHEARGVIDRAVKAGTAILESRSLPFPHEVALVDADTAVDVLWDLIEHMASAPPAEAPVLVAQNAAYDLGVLLQHAHLMELRGEVEDVEGPLHAALFDVMDLDGTGLHDSESLIVDTLYRELLIRNAYGEMMHNAGMEHLAKKYLGKDVSAQKKGTPCAPCNATGSVATVTRAAVPARRLDCFDCAGTGEHLVYDSDDGWGPDGDCVECGGLGKVNVGARPAIVAYTPCTACKGEKYLKPWRLRYHELDGVPIPEWPQAAIDYAMDDAVDAVLVAKAQAGAFGLVDRASGGDVIVDAQGGVTNEAFQVRASWCLRLSSMSGPRSNPDKLATWSAAMEELHQEGLRIGQAAGFIRENGSKNTKVLMQMVEDAYERQGKTPPLTAGGKVSTAKDTIEQCGDEVLISWMATGEGRKAKSTFIPAVERGTRYAVASNPGVLKSTGRTSWSNPMFHQPPRKEGFRECWEPREGNVYASVDWSGAELVALAQIQLLMFGSSAMADAINAGLDLHAEVGRQMMNAEQGTSLTYEEFEALLKASDKEAKGYRQVAKIANFGFPGGLVARTFVDYARGFGVKLTEDQAQTIRNQWLDAWEEMRDYLDFFKRCAAGDGFTYASWVTGRLRGGVRYTNGCNNGFQGLVADGLKLALWWVTREMYTEVWHGDDANRWVYPHSPGEPEQEREVWINTPGNVEGYPDEHRSPLYGYRSWLSIHDEILLEGPEDGAAEAAERLSELMCWALKVFTPDVAVEAEPALMRRWSKDATPAYIDSRLVPWEDAQQEEK